MKPVQVLKPDGSVIKGAAVPDVPDEDLRRMFEVILMNREIDDRMLTVQRQGRIGFYMQSRGEEASILGAVSTNVLASTQSVPWMSGRRRLGAGSKASPTMGRAEGLPSSSVKQCSLRNVSESSTFASGAWYAILSPGLSCQ